MVRELSELFGRVGSWEETKKLDILFKGRNILYHLGSCQHLGDLLAQDPDDMGDQSRHLAVCWPTDCVNWAPRTLEVIRLSNCQHLAYTRHLQPTKLNTVVPGPVRHQIILCSEMLNFFKTFLFSKKKLWRKILRIWWSVWK
jgi:hypothetical protein